MKKRFLAAVLIGLASLMSFAADFTYNGVKPALVIDVRTPDEFAAGHIEGALNIPYDRIGKDIRTVKGLQKDQPVLLYCRSGRRSAIAKAALEKEGYRQVLDGGGINDLAARIKPCTSKAC